MKAASSWNRLQVCCSKSKYHSVQVALGEFIQWRRRRRPVRQRLAGCFVTRTRSYLSFFVMIYLASSCDVFNVAPELAGSTAFSPTEVRLAAGVFCTLTLQTPRGKKDKGMRRRCDGALKSSKQFKHWVCIRHSAPALLHDTALLPRQPLVRHNPEWR